MKKVILLLADSVLLDVFISAPRRIVELENIARLKFHIFYPELYESGIKKWAGDFPARRKSNLWKGQTGLEFDSSHELNNPWVKRSGDTSKIGAVHVAAARKDTDKEVSTVQHVECLSPDLEANPLSNPEILH